MIRGSKINRPLLQGISCILLVFFIQAGLAQDKERLRLSTSYTKVMDGPLYLDFQTSARIDKTNITVPDAELEVYYEVDGQEFPLGTTITGPDGKGQFTLEGLEAIQPDSTGLYILGASFAGNDTFRRASSSVEFRDALLIASLVQKDSLNFIEATLKDKALDSTIADALIRVQVTRMFKPLVISEDLLMTDESGTVMVEIPADIPGKDGNLSMEVVIEENDDYGTVKARLDAAVGTPIVTSSTYDQRTLWGRSGRAPLFILFFTGMLVIGSWGIIFYLLFNLYKITKN
ncbi:hypothetical protein [Robiginitalea aurantiaca]|uniref:Uncharacterized protein n=1 Tax=Robiginitalea aurantiaca TaxID=3056915 RepID=A0ABT7WGP5_9FLAO|nr:hypothetical protein [Robiginitalea aurantiaca]MDM9632090.1 hypothetical protein [Robiginitalea aurantiaca]